MPKQNTDKNVTKKVFKCKEPGCKASIDFEMEGQILPPLPGIRLFKQKEQAKDKKNEDEYVKKVVLVYLMCFKGHTNPYKVTKEYKSADEY